MSTDATLLAVGVDSSSVPVAAKRLDEFGRQASVTEQAVGKLTSKLESFVKGIGIVAIIQQSAMAMINFARDTISAASALDDLADATGSTVEALSQVINQAQVSGVGIDKLQVMFQRLSVGISGVDEESKGAAAALKLLGVTAKDPAEAFVQLADSLDKYADGANKANIIQVALGRGAQAYIPFLKDMAQDAKVAATVTAEQAKAAEDLEKAWRRLTFEASSLKSGILDYVVPAIRDTIGIFNAARSAALGFWEAYNISVTGVWGDAAERLKAETAKMEDMQKKAASASPESSAAAKWLLGVPSDEDLEKQKKLIQGLKNIIDYQLKQQPGVADPHGPLQPKPDAPVVPDTNAAKKALEDYQSAVKAVNQVVNEAKTAWADWGKVAEEKTTPAMKKQMDLMNDPAWKTFTAAQKTVLLNELATADALQKKKAAWDAELKRVQEAIDAEEKLAEAQYKESEARVKVVNDYAEGNENLQKEIDLIGMDSTARELLSAEIEYNAKVREIESARTWDNAEAIAAATEQLRKEYEVRRSLISTKGLRERENEERLAFAEGWKSTLDTVTGWASDFIRDFMENGSSAFNTLWKRFKAWALAALAEIAAKQIVVSIVGAFMGGGAGGSAAQGIGGSMVQSAAGSYLQGAAGGMANSMLGSYTGADVGSVVGGSALSSGMFGGAAAAYASPTAATAMYGGAAAEIMGGTSLAASGGSAMAALSAAAPYIAAVLAIAYFAYEAFGQKPGAPKVGGYAAAGDMKPWNRTDLITDAGLAPGHFTPDQMDSALQPIVNGWVTSIGKTVEALGGTAAASYGYDLGYDTDPGGQANNRLGVRASVNGQQVYNYWSGNDSLGRDDKDLQAAMILASKRAMVAALQASDLPATIAAVFDTVTADTITSEEVDNLMAYVSAMKALSDAIGGDVLADATDLWNRSQMTAYERVKAMGTELVTLAESFDGTTASMQQIAGATATYRGAVIDVLNTIRQVAEQAEAMQDQVAQGIQTFGMSSGQLFNYFIDDANVAVAELLQTTDPAKIAALQTRIYNDVQSAWGALSDEDKAVYKQPLLDFLGEFGAAVGVQLGVAQDDILNGTNSPFAAAGQVLTDAADLFTPAANTQAKAASDFSIAVADWSDAVYSFIDQLPLQVQVSSSSAEVNGG